MSHLYFPYISHIYHIFHVFPSSKWNLQLFLDESRSHFSAMAAASAAIAGIAAGSGFTGPEGDLGVAAVAAVAPMEAASRGGWSRGKMLDLWWVNHQFHHVSPSI